MMHPCLSIPELLALITQYVDGKGSLARLARVSKGFNESALDALYSHIEHIVDLLRSFPADLWNVEGEEGMIPMGRDFKVFNREPTKTEWDTIFSYTSRVKSIREPFFDEWSFTVSEQAFDAMCGWHLPFSSLFPKLHSLRLSFHNPHNMSEYRFFTKFFFQPSLRHLFLRMCQHQLLFECSPNLAALCPRLESVDIMASRSFRGIDTIIPLSSLSRNVCGWKSIRNLDCGPLDVPMLRHVAQLPALNSLTMMVGQRTPWLSDPQNGYFIKLDHLRLMADSFETGTLAIEKLFYRRKPFGKAEIRNLHLKVEISEWNNSSIGSVSRSSFPAVTSALSDHLSYEALKEITIDQCLPDDTDSSHLGEAFTGLLPLTNFSNLTRVEASYDTEPSFIGYHLSEAELGELIRHWPLLENFHCDSFTKVYSLPALVTILRLCPRMRTLSGLFSFELTDLADLYPFSQEAQRNLPRNTEITELSLDIQLPQTRPIELATLVAAFFSLLVPNLSEVSDPEGCFMPADERFWKRVLADMAVNRRSSS